VKAEKNELPIKPKFDESVPFGVEQIDEDVVHQLQVFLFIPENHQVQSRVLVDASGFGVDGVQLWQNVGTTRHIA